MPEVQASQQDNLEEFLLERFTEADFLSARNNLLERYNTYQGLLISKDGSSILSPDDIETFREHAADFSGQKLFSDYENEQLKILTVLIYQLLNASKGVGPISGKQGKYKFWQTYGHFYIFRKIFHHSEKLSFEEIKNLITHQNTIFKLYQQSQPTDSEKLNSTALLSKDDKYFQIRLNNNEFSIAITVPQIKPKKAEKVAAKVEKADSYRHITFCDQEKDSLLETAKSTTFACGVKVAAASYIGVKRKANEDGIVILPDNDQVTVIDGMGGYGNGQLARQLFCQSVIKHAGDIDTAVADAQKNYDVNGLGRGGVCTMNISIEQIGDEYHLQLGQAGDVHLVAFDENFELQYESIDEAIGHKVINAIMGAGLTAAQRKNGWNEFGMLTHNHLIVKKGWRVANFSDGIANQFDAITLRKLITDCTPKTAIGRLSSRLTKMMAAENSYKDNCSIALLDF